MKHIGIVTFPSSKAGVTPLVNLIATVSAITPTVVVISGGEALGHIKSSQSVSIHKVDHISYNNNILRIISYIITQVKISLVIIRQSRFVDTYIFFLGGNSLMLPSIAAKASGSEVVISMAGSLSKSIDNNEKGFANIVELLSICNYAISDKIVIYSQSLIDEWNLHDYVSKIKIAHEHVVDESLFSLKTPICKREKKVGFIGRFSEEKGINELMEAIVLLLRAHREIRFLFVGDGKLNGVIQETIVKYGIQDNVEVQKWVDRHELVNVLNSLKAIILPSRTEGLPNIMLEALACGTPVIVSPVGAIKDLIIDGANGYVLEDNSPECIARTIILALDSDNTEIIANGIELINNEFRFECSIRAWKSVLTVY